MASTKIKGINIKIGADTTGLDKALNGIETKSKSAKNELREIDKTIKNAPDSLTAWKQKQEVLNKAISDSKDKVKLLENAQEQVAKQLADGKISGEQYRAFERELENARSETLKLESQLAGTTQQVRNLENGVSSSADTVRNASDGYSVFKDVLANLATQGINFAFDKLKIFTQQIIETGKTFEASMSNVSAISGATGENLDKLSEKAKQMGATTKYTASQAADAFGYMALAGWETEDMLSGIDGVLNLAAASDMDLAKASDIVTDYLTAFGLTAQDSAKFVDQMSYAMSKSNTTTELLGEAYKNCAATAASMGYSVEDTTAVLMTMANAGVKGGEAGTALNAIMTRLATNTQGCASKLKKLGDIDIYKGGKLQSMSSVLEGVSKLWKTLDDEEKSVLSKQIAGTNHYSALQTIMNGLSDSAKASGMSFTDYSAALEECDGTAQKMADTMIDNLAGDMTILDSSIDGVKLALSEKLNPILRDLVQYITDKMPEIQEKSEQAFDIVTTSVEWAKKNMPEIKKTLEDVLPLIVSIGSGIAGLKVASTVKSAVTGLTSVINGLNTAMLANPATAVAAAIGLLGVAIVAYCIQAETELSELQKISEAVDEQYSKEHKQIDNTRDSLSKINKTFDENAEAIRQEGERAEYLWKQLHELAGESGKVHDSDKIRAKYILGELNQALGTEYELTGNQIEGYQQLRDEIDKTIAKKKAEAYLDALYADSSAMAQNKADTKSAYVTAEKQRTEKRAERDTAQAAFDEINSTDMSAEEIVNYYGKYGSLAIMSESELKKYQDNDNLNVTRGRFTKEQLEAAQTYVNVNQEYIDASTRAREAESNYDNVMEYYNTLDKAETAISEGEYDEVEKIVYTPKDYNQTILENATDFDEEIRNAYNERQTELSYELKLALNAEVANQDEFDDILAEIGENVTLGLQSGAKSDEVITQDMKDVIKDMISKEFDISALSDWGKDIGLDVDDLLGNDFSEIFSVQAKKGYNIESLLEWIGNSGKKIAKEAWSDVADYINKQMKATENYDLTPILKTAQKAGIDIGETFGENYIGLVQNQIDEGFDPSALINWFIETDKKAAESFKKNYKELSQTLLDEGYDPTSILMHFAETDKKFAENFKKNCKDVIQDMLDAGFNPTSLIQWFMDNGVKFGDVMSSEIRIQFEKMLSDGFDTTKFFEWLSNVGLESGDVWGKHFQDAVNQYLYQLEVKAGKTKPNSAWDSALYEGKVNWNEVYPSYRFTQYATGGYISSGNRAIVAEAGPELLEVMNGGIRVTPLTDSAYNTSAGGSQAGQKIFYNTYNINNPKIASGMDIETIAHKLATEQKRIEVGRGLK